MVALLSLIYPRYVVVVCTNHVTLSFVIICYERQHRFTAVILHHYILVLLQIVYIILELYVNSASNASVGLKMFSRARLLLDKYNNVQYIYNITEENAILPANDTRVTS